MTGSLAALERPTVAVVGPRAPSTGGLERAREIATGLSRAGVCVISGLALGIDGSAHAAALAGPTPTIGVLGGGHRCFFPKGNRALADRMLASGGAVLSPYAPDEPARPSQFLQRNGVVAALADAVVVVEAAARSGALNTASWAASLGIDVLALPGDVDRALAAGCNALIRDGATLVRDAGDVLEALASQATTAASRRRPARRKAGNLPRAMVCRERCFAPWPTAPSISKNSASEPARRSATCSPRSCAWKSRGASNAATCCTSRAPNAGRRAREATCVARRSTMP